MDSLPPSRSRPSRRCSEGDARGIDPETERVDTFEDVGDYPDGLLAHDGALWIASDLGPELRRLDPATGEVAGPWVVGEQGVINANQLVVEAEGSF